MNLPNQVPGFYKRAILFGLICMVILFLTLYILPGSAQNAMPDIALNPVAEIGMFVILALIGGLIGFWLTFGDVMRQQNK